MRHELNPTVKGKLEMPCQQQGVTAIRGTGAVLQLMWTGERCVGSLLVCFENPYKVC